MEKKVIILIFIVILILIISTLFCTRLVSEIRYEKVEGNAVIEQFRYEPSERRSITEHIYKEGCVRDEHTAAKIAVAIFNSVYGFTNENNDVSLIVAFDDVKEEWLIRTHLPPKNLSGGSMYLILKKKNAEVVAIWATR